MAAAAAATKQAAERNRARRAAERNGNAKY
jgi:hypothetical protein